MLVSDFNFHLPEELIAQEPLADRAASRMLCLNRATGIRQDRVFANLPELLRPNDLLVFNNTRVFPARLYGRRAGGEGKIEVLLTRQVSGEPNEWECLVRPGKKVGVGERLHFGEGLDAEVVSRADFGERRIRFSPVPDFFERLEKLGHVPLPPYITREDRNEDRERYQTVFARERGSVAAPTAGLHFTPQILDRIRARGIETAELTLHVGLGTFQSIRVNHVEEHKLHREHYSISEAAANAINGARREHRRVVAVGTTTVRTLEYAASQSPEIQPGLGEADIFIYPGCEFKVVDAMLTNFHLPQSSLLMLVCAFAGKGNVLAAYRHAVESKYRFYSYGDCMFME
ncbi:MAG: tRNA preQ1(34) S-adenosylmethionine ribosyltransferase-isomerase QueA [Terriglobales bacterium]